MLMTRFFPALLSVLLIAGSCGDDDNQNPSGAVDTTSTTAGGQGPSGEDERDAFVGRVEGTDAYVAVAPGPDGVVAYVCDGKDLVAYLSGEQSGSTLTADEPAELISLRGQLDGATVTGTVTAPDGEHSFTASRAEGDAGYFRSEVRDGDLVTTGAWIRLDDGTVRGAAAGLSVANVAATNSSPVTTVPAAGSLNLGNGSSVPPDAVAFGFVANVQCGIASFRAFRANKRFDESPTGDNATRASNARQNANEACNPGSGTN